MVFEDGLAGEPADGVGALGAIEAEARALAACNDNVAEAAKQLNTDRANLYRRMRRLGIER